MYEVRAESTHLKKDWRKIHKEDRPKIVAAIERLSINPRPDGCTKLHSGDYRIRVGTYRVIYTVDDPNQVVYVLAVGHRSSIY